MKQEIASYYDVVVGNTEIFLLPKVIQVINFTVICVVLYNFRICVFQSLRNYISYLMYCPSVFKKQSFYLNCNYFYTVKNYDTEE